MCLAGEALSGPHRFQVAALQELRLGQVHDGVGPHGEGVQQEAGEAAEASAHLNDVEPPQAAEAAGEPLHHDERPE